MRAIYISEDRRRILPVLLRVASHDADYRVRDVLDHLANVIDNPGDTRIVILTDEDHFMLAEMLRAELAIGNIPPVVQEFADPTLHTLYAELSAGPQPDINPEAYLPTVNESADMSGGAI